MGTEPRWRQTDARFRHRESIEAVIQNGGYFRADSRIHNADDLVGLYQIRLNIANDPSINPNRGMIIEDLEQLVSGLKARQGHEISVWFVRDSENSPRFWIFEDRASGKVISCLNFPQRAASDDQ